MKNKLKLSFVPLLFLGLSNLQAQEVIPATGGDASGSGGSASYTVGQVVYTTNVGTNGNSVAEGVQQPYEISVETGIEQKGINLEYVIYPNPVTDYLILKIDDDNVQTGHALSQLSYQLFNTDGKMVATGKVITAETKIATGNLPQGTYLLRITEKDKAIKTFKIIKY